jgi:hypothetical protein
MPIRRLGPIGRLGTVAPGHGYSRRDRDADDRDTEAGDRDREADQRDREADRRDRNAEIVSLEVSNGSADLHGRRQLVVARHRAASEREQAALDRAAASADRRRAALDRQVATAEREDSQEERLQSDRPGGLPATDDEGAAVAAHTLLNSSAVVAMGITTLLAQHDELTSPERRHLLERMLAHATRVDQRLKGITRGVVPADEP